MVQGSSPKSMGFGVVGFRLENPIRASEFKCKPGLLFGLSLVVLEAFQQISLPPISPQPNCPRPSPEAPKFLRIVAKSTIQESLEGVP